MQPQIAPSRHEQALNQIAQCIRDCPDTGGGVQLRRFLWSLYNQHHLVNLWTLVNPNRRRGKPCVYVGMSGLTPEERFTNHKQGIKAAAVVQRYGLRLLPELYAHLNPMPYEAAAQMEKDLAEDLRRAGYTVTGGH